MRVSPRLFTLIWSFVNVALLCSHQSMVDCNSIGNDTSIAAHNRTLQVTAVLQITAIQLVDADTASPIVTIAHDSDRVEVNLATLTTITIQLIT